MWIWDLVITESSVEFTKISGNHFFMRIIIHSEYFFFITNVWKTNSWSMTTTVVAVISGLTYKRGETVNAAL